MILCKPISLFLRRIKNISSFLVLKQYFNTSVTKSSSEYTPKILTHDLVKNHSEWFILKGYVKYLVDNPNECKFERCVNILINIGDRITQYNKKQGYIDTPTTRWEWNMGILRQISGTGSLNLVGDNFSPFDAMKMLKLFSKLRLYYRINNHKFDKKQNKNDKDTSDNNTNNNINYKVNSNVNSNSILNLNYNINSNMKKSYNFFNDLIDDINPKSFRIIGCNFKYQSIGPLRFNGDGFIAYPMILSNPFLFELTDSNFPIWLENTINNIDGYSKSTRKNFNYFIDTVVTQLLDQLLILIKNSYFSVSKLCIISMYLSVMIYGSKLRRKDSCKIDSRVLNSLQKILDYTLESVKMNKDNISLRSLAYLANCSKPDFDLLNIVAKRIIESDVALDADYLENFCFVFTRCYYKNDLLYYKLASFVNQDSSAFTPVVTVNLILSFSRVGKLNLVKYTLFDRLLSFSERDFKKLSPSLFDLLSKLTEEYPELSDISYNQNRQNISQSNM